MIRDLPNLPPPPRVPHPMAARGIPLWPWLNRAAGDLPVPERLPLDAAILWQHQARAGHAPAPALACCWPLRLRARPMHRSTRFPALRPGAPDPRLPPAPCHPCGGRRAFAGGFPESKEVRTRVIRPRGCAGYRCFPPARRQPMASASVSRCERRNWLCARHSAPGPRAETKSPARMPPHSRPFVHCKNIIFPAAYPVISRNMD